MSFGYLKSHKTSYKLSLDKFRDLHSNGVNHHCIHFGSAHPHNQKLTYYLCKDTLIFDSPTIQNESGYAHYQLRYSDKFDSMLRKCLIINLKINKIMEK